VCAQKQKPSIAVLTLKNAAEVKQGEAEIISDRLRIELFNTGNVDVMEREQMQTILQEQGFQASGACTDEGCMVELGKLLGVQNMITGSMGKLGNLYLLNVRSIDVKTGKIMRVVSRDIKGDIEEVVGHLSDIAYELTGVKTAPAALVRQKDETTSAPAPAAEPPKSTEKVEWQEIVFLEPIDLQGKISFTLSRDNVEDLNDALKSGIEGAVEDEIDDDLDVEVFTPQQIKQLPPECKSGVVRATLDAYTTRKSGVEIIGKARATFYFYSTPRSENPVFKITIEGEGDRDPGDWEPLMNAFEELADLLEDALGDADKIECLNPAKKK